MNFRKVKAVLGAIGLTLGPSFFGLIFALVVFLLMASFAYFGLVVFKCLLFGDFVWLCEKIDVSPTMIYVEQWFFWISISFWALLAIGHFVFVVKEYYIILKNEMSEN